MEECTVRYSTVQYSTLLHFILLKCLIVIKPNKANKAFKRFKTSDQLQQLLHQLLTNHSTPYIDTPNNSYKS